MPTAREIGVLRETFDLQLPGIYIEKSGETQPR